MENPSTIFRLQPLQIDRAGRPPVTRDCLSMAALQYDYRAASFGQDQTTQPDKIETHELLIALSKPDSWVSVATYA